MYTDLLTKIKNAQLVKKESIKTPYSRMSEAILDILARHKYLDGFEKKGRGSKKILDIKLKYDDGRGAISGMKFLSKPSRRLYAGYKDLRPVKHGYGLMVLSSPKGIVTGADARKYKVGGELLFQIW